MKNYLVTGGCGFIGSHLVDRLVGLGHHVCVIDDMSIGSYKYTNHEANYCFKSIKKLSFKDFNKPWDCIFHLAAVSRIQPSITNPFRTVKINVEGTCKILEIARETKSHFVFTSSCSCYEDSLNPYSLSKKTGEDLCKLYNKLYGVNFSVLRLFNVYGPRQYETGDHATVCGIFENQKRNNIPLTITGSGNQCRDFVHIDDVVNAFLTVADNPTNDIMNVGTGTAHSILEVAKFYSSNVNNIPAREGEMDYVKADTRKMNELGWMPKIKLEEYVKNIN